MNPSAHLSEEALSDLLIGLGTRQAEAHLAACASCRGQLEEFRAGMQVFNQASLAWSAARPAARPAAPAKVRELRFAPAVWALAVLLLLMVGVPLWYRAHRPAQNSDTARVVASEETQAQIAQDNELLRSVNEALSASEASPLSEYHLTERPRAHRQTRPESRTR
jgi:hypothetical protein